MLEIKKKNLQKKVIRFDRLISGGRAGERATEAEPCMFFLYRPFHNFRASRSGNRRILLTSRTSFDGFRSSKIVKGSVG